MSKYEKIMMVFGLVTSVFGFISSVCAVAALFLGFIQIVLAI